MGGALKGLGVVAALAAVAALAVCLHRWLDLESRPGVHAPAPPSGPSTQSESRRGADAGGGRVASSEATGGSSTAAPASEASRAGVGAPRRLQRRASWPEGIIAARPGAPPTPPRPPGAAAAFENATVRVGIHHVHERGVFDLKLSNIMPWISSIGSAVATSDVDGDGDIDIYATSSRRGRPNALYLNRLRESAAAGGPPELHFEEAAAAAGIAAINDDDGVSMDAAFADLDGDGDPELYVVQWGENRLFRNDGGRFTEVTDEAGVGDRGNGNCVLFFDHDNDGDLDILVCNYFPSVDLWHLASTLIMHDSFEKARNGGANVLYRNDGNLKFTEVSHNLDLDDRGWSLDAGISDIDNDGDIDLYIANDFGPDRLFLGDGHGVFLDVTEQAIGFDNKKGMNVDFGDFDGDGFTDIQVSNITTAEYLKEGNMLWLNNGDGTFTDVARTTGTADGGWGWGGRFFDYDLDGDLDLLTVNGFVSASKTGSYWDALAQVAVKVSFQSEDASQWPDMRDLSLSGYEPTRLFRNEGSGSFQECAAAEQIDDRHDGRGIALADLDDDGDLDVLIASQNQPLQLFLNRSSQRGHWLSMRLRGTRSNPDAIGARVELEAGELRMVREVNGINGFSSQSDYAVFFGLAKEERADRVTIFWPSGVVQTFEDLPAGRHYLVEERGEPLPLAERRKLYLAARYGGERRRREDSGGEDPAVGAVLVALEKEILRKPRNGALANLYRARARELGAHRRAVEFLRDLVARYSSRSAPPALRLQLSLALIDEIPRPELDALQRASLAKESLAQLERILAERPDDYCTHFICAMNHLYWPASLHHAPQAVEHFERCLEILDGATDAEVARDGLPRDDTAHRHDLFVALGDARVKRGELEAARATWKRALQEFPGDKELLERAAMPDEALVEHIRSVRGLKLPIDTSLRVLERQHDLGRREEALRLEPEDREALNAYRREAAELDAAPRAEAFLRSLVEASPAGSAEPRLQLALLLLDAITAPGSAPADPERREARRREAIDLTSAFRKLRADDALGPLVEVLIRLRLLGAERRTEGAGAGAAAATEAGAAAAAGTESESESESVTAAGVAHRFAGELREALAAAEEARRLGSRADGTPRIEGPVLARGDVLALLGRVGEARREWASLGDRGKLSAALSARRETRDEALGALVLEHWRRKSEIFTDLGPYLDLESELAQLERRIAERFTRALGDRYRHLVRRAGQPRRGIAFLEQSLERDPASSDRRVALALTLLDHIPDRALGSVEKGRLASRALEVLDPLLAARPRHWGLQVMRGTIHLDWFTKLGHVPEAISAFEKAIAIFEEAFPPSPGGASPAAPERGPGESEVPTRWAEAYRALGDALVKGRRFIEARKRWKKGLARFPEDPGLKERLGLTSLMVNDWVERTRSWGTPADTDLLFEVIGALERLAPAPPSTAAAGESPPQSAPAPAASAVPAPSRSE